MLFRSLPIWEKGYRTFNTGVSYTIWGYWAWALDNIIGLRIRYVGDTLPSPESSIVIGNHQGFMDIMAMLCFGFKNHVVQYMKWMIKNEFKYIPAIGWGTLFVDSVFLKRNWSQDRSTILRTFARYKQNPDPIWLVLLPEGTRMTPAKLQRSQKFAAKYGHPIPLRVLTPRTKGFCAAVTGLGARMDSVVSVTIDYGKRAPSIMEFMRGDCPEIAMMIKRTPISELPRDEKGLEEWLRKDFQERDLLLQKGF